MTKLTVDYVSGVDETDLQEQMSDAEAVREQARQWDAILARVRGRKAKDFTEALHPRDAEGQFTETGAGGATPSWEQTYESYLGRARIGSGKTHAAVFETPDAYADSVSQTAGRPDGRYVTACGLSLAPDTVVASDSPITCKACLRSSADTGGKYSPDQPRDHGRFAEVPGLTPAQEDALGDTALRTGGFSVSRGGDLPESGWMVSRAGSERSFPIEALASEQPMSANPGNPWHDNVEHAIEGFVNDHAAELRAPGAFLGGWVDSGRLFLDCSVNIQDDAEAEKFAKENDQFAMYNAGTGEYRSFEQTRRAASRKSTAGLREKTKVYISVGDSRDFSGMATKLLKALAT